MTQPWQGKSMWVWYISECEGGNVADIIKKAQAAHIESLLIKAHDGVEWWPQFSESLVTELHAANIRVGAWGYCYGEPQQEAALAVKALDMGADFYVADVEVQYESLPASVAAEFMQAIRAGANGKQIGYSSFGLPDYHKKFPWQTFSEHADFAMPQIYWGDFAMAPTEAVSASLNQYHPYHIPVAPTGQAYGNVTPEQMQEFIKACDGYHGISWWSYQHATETMWNAIIGEPEPGVKPEPSAKPEPPPKEEIVIQIDDAQKAAEIAEEISQTYHVDAQVKEE